MCLHLFAPLEAQQLSKCWGLVCSKRTSVEHCYEMKSVAEYRSTRIKSHITTHHAAVSTTHTFFIL